MHTEVNPLQCPSISLWRNTLTKKKTPDKPRIVRQLQGTYTRVKQDKTKYNRKRLNNEEKNDDTI